MIGNNHAATACSFPYDDRFEPLNDEGWRRISPPLAIKTVIANKSCSVEKPKYSRAIGGLSTGDLMWESSQRHWP